MYFVLDSHIQYDPLVADRTNSEDIFITTDSTEIFIHGILSDKRTGTCSSLPTFAIAVGRRLGYPLKLVLVPNHTLYRWHDEHEQHNYQHTQAGGDIHPDEYFLTWPRPWDDLEHAINRQTNYWLTSLTPTQEVSKFLCNRSLLLYYQERFSEAADSAEAANRYYPGNPMCSYILEAIVK
jgi:regulator of sirC expression with transglutaminase-like and TPR domain